MSKLFKNSKQIMAIVMAFAILAVSLFAGSIVASAETTDSLCKGTKILYWDGTKDTQLTGQGTKEDPYMITNAAELNYVCTVANKASEDKYYVVDPTIKAFILQPQATVDAIGGASAFMDIASAAATKELFEVKAAGKSLMNWLKNGSGSVFAGHFDGNGVEIYGLYSDSTLVKSEQSALFPIVDGNGANVDTMGLAEKPTTLTNFAVKNSYIKGYRRVGAVIATAWYNEGGTACDGWIEFTYCEIANNFLVGQDLIVKDKTIANAGWSNGDMGIVGGAMANDPMRISYTSVYGNDTEYRVYGSGTSTTYSVDASKKFNRLTAYGTQSGAGVRAELHKSILLDAKVPEYNGNTADHTYVSDVYTTVASSINGVTVIENDGYGTEGQAAMEKLDWENDWFMGENGPTLRAFHGAIELSQTETTHHYACKDCGFMSYGGEVAHNWDANYVCKDCKLECTHGSQQIDPDYKGDCVTPPGYFVKCNYCLKETITNPGVALGHVLTWVPEIYADCEKEGRAGYWHCETCKGNFTADSEEAAKWASMDTNIANPDVDLITPIAPHNALNREDGTIIVVQDGNSGHYWLCYTCDGRLITVESKKYADEDQIKKHKYDAGVCEDCGWECPEHDYQPTGVLIVPGTCEIDREEELKCTNCGDKKIKVTTAGHNIIKFDEVAATDRLEGTKAHYECTVCKEVYLDAEGKTMANSASLVIPKVLPLEYQNQIQGNVDTSDKSPSTGDSVTSVLAVAALAGAAFVMVRKAKR